MTDKKIFNINSFHILALTVAVLGAVGSLYFIFNASHNQKSILLIILFTAWVLSPFAGLFVACKISGSWTVRARSSLYWLTIILTICSLVMYSGALLPPKTKLTPVFLLVPLISVPVIITSILLARKPTEKK
jgi:hypothetical protein